MLVYPIFEIQDCYSFLSKSIDFDMETRQTD